VTGITVNTVHGRNRSIAAVTERFAPQVESMEGAAFMYACLVHDQRFAQVRAVSNVVERRNREAWKLSEAVASLGATTLRMLSEL
jgi:futalosine hydrolase